VADRYATVDRPILAVLEVDGRISNAELAARVGLSPSPCLRRVRRLEEAGVIRGYRALIDPAAVGRGLRVFAGVRLLRHGRGRGRVRARGGPADRGRALPPRHPYWTVAGQDRPVDNLVTACSGIGAQQQAEMAERDAAADGESARGLVALEQLGPPSG
jgi:DNA-binding Lrp family transcriptional regulator